MDEVPTELESSSLVIIDVESMPRLSAAMTVLENAGVPVICAAREQDLVHLVKAMPTAGIPILIKPLQSEVVVETVDTTLRREVQARTLAEKYRKMRQLVRRVIRDRRDINRRVELVCRDLVEAHRRLTYRFVEIQKTQAAN